MMNVTSDPNQANMQMFGIGCPYPNNLMVNTPFMVHNGIQPLEVAQSITSETCPNVPEATNNSPYLFTPTSCPSVPEMVIPPGVNSFPFSPTQPFNNFSFSSLQPIQFSNTPNIMNTQVPQTMSCNFPLSSYGGNQGSTSLTVSSTYAAPIVCSRPLIGSFGCKRKCETSSYPPAKQLVTEEHMAEHMSKLYISSESAPSSNEPTPSRQRRLYMCDEMRRLQAESIIPAQLLAKVQRPCTALVPWTPPVVPPIVKENNNNEEEPDNNQTGSDEGAQLDMEL